MAEQNLEKEARRRFRAWRFLQRVAPFFFKKYHCEMEEIAVEGPFLLIANHACNMDPIFAGLASPRRPMTYVASEHLMRLGFITKLLTRFLSVIPRPKASMAIDTIRAITKALKEGDPVVLFAEGDNTWNGVTGKVFPATGKLVKMLKVPLVTYRMEGNYLTKPRWAVKARKGRVKGTVVHVYSPEELAKMRPQEIDACMNQDIHVDPWSSQKEDPVPFKGKRLAENVEKAVFICPECGSIGSLYSKGNLILCRDCGHQTTMDVYGTLSGGRFTDLYQWDSWQAEAYKEFIDAREKSGLFAGEGIMSDLEKGEEKQVRFSLDLADQALVINENKILFTDISDISMVKTERLLFTSPDGYFEIQSPNGILRPYVLAWQEINKKAE